LPEKPRKEQNKIHLTVAVVMISCKLWQNSTFKTRKLCFLLKVLL